jgi:hypothetical protein
MWKQKKMMEGGFLGSLEPHTNKQHCIPSDDKYVNTYFCLSAL